LSEVLRKEELDTAIGVQRAQWKRRYGKAIRAGEFRRWWLLRRRLRLPLSFLRLWPTQEFPEIFVAALFIY
jgi:hypothetical protein